MVHVPYETDPKDFSTPLPLLLSSNKEKLNSKTDHGIQLGSHHDPFLFLVDYDIKIVIYGQLELLIRGLWVSSSSGVFSLAYEMHSHIIRAVLI